MAAKKKTNATPKKKSTGHKKGKTAFEKIKGGLEDAIKYAQGDASAGKETQRHIALEGNLTTEQMLEIAKGPDPQVRMKLAGRADLPLEVAEVLAKDPVKLVRKRAEARLEQINGK